MEGCDMREALIVRPIRLISATVEYSSVDLFLWHLNQ